MNKKTIITILLALVAMSADSQRLNKDVERIQYVYAMGFNLLRLSDKLKIDYKYAIFKDVSTCRRKSKSSASEMNSMPFSPNKYKKVG